MAAINPHLGETLIRVRYVEYIWRLSGSLRRGRTWDNDDGVSRSFIL